MFDVAERLRSSFHRKYLWAIAAAVGSIIAVVVVPEVSVATARFVAANLVSVAPVLSVGLLISAWVTASGAGGVLAASFKGHHFRVILLASAIGTVTPVCGVTVLPLMTGLLAAGVPLAPVMAFWLSSPVTDPGMFAATAATLGMSFAIAKTLAAFAIGALGGVVTNWFATRPWVQSPLRASSLRTAASCWSCGQPSGLRWDFWRDGARRQVFVFELWAMTRLVTICLTLAFAAEYLMKDLLPPDFLASYVGRDTKWAVPLAVFVGAPIYLDGYAALPLVRGLMDLGMSAGAAMAFLVSGSVVSIWGAIAILPVLRPQPFLLYLTLAVVGSLMVGWAYDLVAS